jgi:hypothetical protein
MKPLLTLLCLTNILIADTNVVIQPSNTSDKMDVINKDMKERYKLSFNNKNAMEMTGYIVQDPLTKLFRTYSVLHVEF